jgi:hypothetical protein
MGKKSNGRSEQLRSMVAEEAAKIMAEEWLSDFGQAKRKAAQRLGVTDRAALPSNREIEVAVIDRQRLFGQQSHDDQLRHQRELARQAMRLLEKFEPRLIGAVLKGTATEYSEISLHLFSDTAEDIALHLMSQEIPFDTDEKRVRYGDDRVEYRPVFRFEAAGAQVAATVFPLVGMRQSPLSPVDGRPIRRARLSDVEALLSDGCQVSENA